MKTATVSDIEIKQVPIEDQRPAERMGNCRNYDSCKAPICPLNGVGIWYPDEAVCGRRGLGIPWVKTQRKIQRRVRSRDTFYTAADLAGIQRVSVSTKGRSPDTTHGNVPFETTTPTSTPVRRGFVAAAPIKIKVRARQLSMAGVRPGFNKASGSRRIYRQRGEETTYQIR